MNRSSMSKQMMSKGGKLNMVKGKDGKMVPDYAADGKGKMKAGGMAKAYQEGGPVVPTKEEYEAMSPKEKAAHDKKVMMQNLNLSPKEEAAKKAMMKKDPEMGRKKPTMKYKEGGMAKKPKAKARGYGMARGGKVCKMR